METLTLFTKEDVQKLVAEAVADAMSLNVPKPIRKTNLDLPEAKEYLISIGYKCSDSQLYKLSMRNEIPMAKFGRKLLFDADNLSKWVESKKQKTIDVSMAVARSATSKLRD
ncbi:MAG: helix-turn-helix domain-containing protein [Paludibacter sp.]|nr:helix-turn-helix domain-containing protein [Paludibacter sp.]